MMMNILLCLFVFFVTRYYCINYHNNFFLKYLMRMSYTSIYYYSKLQLGYIKSKKLIKEYIETKPLLLTFVNKYITGEDSSISLGEPANYKFVMTEICINDKCIPVNFVTDHYNYLMVNTLIDSNFIKLLLKTHYSSSFDNLSEIDMIDRYTIKIIDNNINIVNFDNTQKLLINKNDYLILDNNSE